MHTIIRYSFPTNIHFGAGARWGLLATLREAKVKRPLLVTDRTVAQLPMAQELCEGLEQGGLNAQIYSQIWGNPVASQVTAGVHVYKEQGRDSIVALGGGAALDVAKCIALMAHHPGKLFDYEDGKPNALPISGPIPFLAALPTTSGTGSEVGRSAVVSDDVTHAKKIIFDARLLPQQVFVDPELTLGLSAAITANTGMDALTHCVESYLSQGFHPMCDGIALEGMRLVSRSLKACVDFARAGAKHSPGHLEARGLMGNAALMGGVAFQKGLGVNHSCAHALSTVCDLHHGLANAVMLPHTLAFYYAAVPERFAAMAQAVGAAEGCGFIPWVKQLNQDMGVPAHLAILGVKQTHMESLIRFAMADACHTQGPRPVTPTDIEHLFVAALSA